MNLDIHLDSGDSFGSTGNLEVHVSEEVLETLDIGKEYKIIIGLTGNKSA